ncbi:hypothetical protein [Cellvibrio sp. NN19]|uniref:hypothetical protein n=1 Tax=Cellvibrio chitinivorans TaxID=3102792 RepID=UPI002B40B4A4|nr:hypothetical protein [Cellvibrio sp. NN19]
MSLILDALNRAENERKNQNAVPDLNTLHRPQALYLESDRRRSLGWIIAGVVIVIAVIAAAIFFLRAEPVAPSAASAPSNAVAPKVEQQQANQAASASVAAAPVVESVAPVDAPVKPAPQAAVPQTSISQSQEKAAQTTEPSADVNQLYAAEDAEPSAPVDTGVNELYAAEAATTAASESIVDPFNQPVAVNQAATAQEVASPRTFDSIKNIPDFNALPWNMRQQIPTISYARHNYLAGGVSSVVINNQTTGVGNIIGTGQFVVQEIFVDGVVLKHGNAVFKLRALTGWINM